MRESVHRTARAQPKTPSASEAAPVTVGNRALQAALQRSLQVGRAGDRFEQEADAVADRVMRMPAQEGTDAAAELVQRCPGGCPGEEELRRQPEEEELIQASGETRVAEVDPATAGAIVAAQGEGAPLPASEQHFFEPRFRRSFAGVRVHADDQANGMARRVNARAFTVGRDVFFGAGEWRPGTSSGRHLLAHELTHTLQQNTVDTARRQAAAVPAFRDCTTAIAGRADANDILENARLRARSFVGAAIRVLGSGPVAGTAYATAAQRHFISPTAPQRTVIQATYRQILRNLTPRNFICNTGAICGTEQAFWIPQDDLIHVCQPFWTVDRTCQAVVLIHEAAHDAGIDTAGAHVANRGAGAYPSGNNPPPVGQTAVGRMGNSDAYAFFAAHVWRSTDAGRTCF
jgi:hypothetical protein